MKNLSHNIEPEVAALQVRRRGQAADSASANTGSSDIVLPGRGTKAARGTFGIGVTTPTWEYDRETARRLDQYYTDPALAAYCMAIVRAKFGDLSQMILVEPSAGDGSFLKVMPAGTIAVDIDPRAPGITKADFLACTFDNDRKIGFVGNPPYGRCSNKALAFINYAAKWATFIAFVLPRTFKKEGTQAKINQYFHLIHEEVVPDHAFLFCGQPYDVPAVFQIWVRRRYKREQPSNETAHPDFVFTTPERADFAMQRVGANAGRIHYNFGLSGSSHFFILGKVQHIMRQLDLASVAANTAGNPSISKSEIVRLYREHVATKGKSIDLCWRNPRS